MRILHTSDLHGRYKPLLTWLARDDYDIWVDTGDFLPNKAAGSLPFDMAQRRHQLRWLGFKQLARRISDALDGRPAVCVAGNHDFLQLAGSLRAKTPHAFQITAGQTIEVQGVRFAGFDTVPGEEDSRWRGCWAQDRFEPVVEAAVSAKPDILVTHAPPHGVLDQSAVSDEAHWGIKALEDVVRANRAPWRLHLFGHVHQTGGSQQEMNGVRHVNSALGSQIVTLGVGATSKAIEI